MLAANVCAAAFLKEHEHPVLYRVHEGPTPEKLEAVREFFKEFGLQLGGGDDPQAGDYSKLLKQIKGRPDAGLLQTVMLRSLRQAVYAPENLGHFGLATRLMRTSLRRSVVTRICWCIAPSRPCWKASNTSRS